jgi:alpha-galactosidase
LFNVGDDERTITVRFADLKMSGRHTVRDLWRQKDVGAFEERFEAPVPPHGVVLVKLTPAK